MTSHNTRFPAVQTINLPKRNKLSHLLPQRKVPSIQEPIHITVDSKEEEQQYLDDEELSPTRRRAGTMPSQSTSFPYNRSYEFSVDSSPDFNLLDINGSLSSFDNIHRNRSGSFHQTPFTPGIFSNSNSNNNNPVYDTMPTTDQLLKGDYSDTVTSTLASLGLDAEEEQSYHQRPSLHTSQSLSSFNEVYPYHFHHHHHHQRSSVYGLPPSASRSANSSPTTEMKFRGNASPNTNHHQLQLYSRHAEDPLQDTSSLSSDGSRTIRSNMPTPITRHQQQSPCLRLSEWGPDEVYTHNVNEKEYLAIDDDASSQPSSNNSTSQQPTRTLWIGNLDNTWTLDDLATLFGPFGSIDTIRHLPNKECAFINFNRVEDAIKAKEAVVHQMNHRLGTSLVRVGFGKSDYPLATTTLECEQGPTRALWIGNLPLTITPSTLFTLFSNFGVIESVRILNHKNCGFVNFTNQQDAICAKQALQSKEILGPGSGMIRIGFAKVPSLGKLSQQQQQQYETGINMSTYSDNGVGGSTNEKVMMDPRVLCQTGGDNPTGVLAAMATERHYIMNKLGDDSDGDDTVVLDQSYRSLKYYPTIAPAPEIGQYRTVDIPRLRDIRKLLDNDGYLSEVEVDKMAMECLGDLVELCSDSIGNTVVQRLFERCSEPTKSMMLGVVAPYLASIGVHKNGTWSAQKIVDTSKLTHQINTVCEHLRPYVPALLLDPFGNYVVQCCLALGPDINQFIFDAIVDNCWEIAQGRFGARAVRATLESPHVTRYQQRYVAATLIQYALLLATNPNGALLLIWLLDTSGIPNRYRILCPHLLPHLSKLCTHKLASLTILKLINQRHEPEARQQILDTLFFSSPPSSLLHEVLMDQVHGVSLIQKILSSSYVALTERQRIADQVKQMLVKHKLVLVQGYKRLLEEINMVMVDSNPSLATTGLAWINQEWAAHYITAATTVIQQQQQQDHTATTYSDDDDDTKTCAIQSPDTNLHL